MQGVDINIKRISLPPKRKKQVILPDAAEVLALIIGTDIELPCLLAMWMSLRISEVRGLQFRDIAKDGSSLQVCRAKMYFDGHDVVRDVNKTYDSTRNNSLPVYLLEMPDFALDEELAMSFIRAGARGKITAPEDDLTVFEDTLEEISRQCQPLARH